MDPSDEEIPGVTDDAVIRLILNGRARTLDEAEEIYLDESPPSFSNSWGRRSRMRNSGNTR